MAASCILGSCVDTQLSRHTQPRASSVLERGCVHGYRLWCPWRARHALVCHRGHWGYLVTYTNTAVCHSHTPQPLPRAMAWIQFDLRSDSNSPGCRECHRCARGWVAVHHWACWWSEAPAPRGAVTVPLTGVHPRMPCPQRDSLTSVPSGAKGGNGKLYLFGGNDQNVRMNEVHAFDTGAWPITAVSCAFPARVRTRSCFDGALARSRRGSQCRHTHPWCPWRTAARRRFPGACLAETRWPCRGVCRTVYRWRQLLVSHALHAHWCTIDNPPMHPRAYAAQCK